MPDQPNNRHTDPRLDRPHDRPHGPGPQPGRPPGVGRRRLLATPLQAGLLAMAGRGLAAGLLPGASSALAQGTDPADRLLDQRAGGRRLSPEALLAELRTADVVLLGELHDNPHHHARRGALLGALRGSGAVVVAEHLTEGLAVQAGADPLLQRLVAAGFDAAGWGWPLHQPLFEAIERAGLPLRGGNLSREAARQIAREGDLALPPTLRPLLGAAPLGDAARRTLDDELVAGHCGQLPASRLPGMRSAQRARDAAMWRALAASGGRPAVLVAGNGHVRRDFGVPTIAAATSAGLRLLSVGFGELGDVPAAAEAAGPCDVLWLTPAAQRDDPCAGMGGAPAAATAASAASAAAPARPAR